MGDKNRTASDPELNRPFGTLLSNFLVLIKMKQVYLKIASEKESSGGTAYNRIG
ncbi:hypothetical protein CHA01nite_34740 [Chryseobacterium hagamense]|uniref:Uncharacterized protein n=1 Tax=Chryseobacterium hagamense TaxID=395935 RepID=A0A511YRB4_9FLAO|nr:hypothetical protein CHA01nite_34740 [Chryseobacterium hagamense]